MSSAKDYIFETATNSNGNSISFAVRNKPSAFYRFLRVPLAGILMAGLLPHAPQFWAELGGLFSGGITLRGPNASAASGLREYVHILLVLVVLIVLGLILSIQQTADKFMVIKGLGVQIGRQPRFRFLREQNGKFIPITEIIDIVIHEGFQGFQVVFYMCVLVREKDESGGEGNAVKVIFPNFLPRKNILLHTWKASRQMLYGTTRRHYRHVPGQGLREVNHLMLD